MTAETGSHDQVHEILMLRTRVARLGELTAPPWWRTQFLTDVGLRALTRVFPRTAASAALSSVVMAARAEHDKRIGVGNRYHLFRLPASLEHAVTLRMSEPSFGSQAAEIVAERLDELIQELRTMAHGGEATALDGPIRIGRRLNIADVGGVQTMAAHYRSSFETGRRAFPYFDDVEGKA